MCTSESYRLQGVACLCMFAMCRRQARSVDDALDEDWTRAGCQPERDDRNSRLGGLLCVSLDSHTLLHSRFAELGPSAWLERTQSCSNSLASG